MNRDEIYKEYDNLNDNILKKFLRILSFIDLLYLFICLVFCYIFSGHFTITIFYFLSQFLFFFYYYFLSPIIAEIIWKKFYYKELEDLRVKYYKFLNHENH